MASYQRLPPSQQSFTQHTITSTTTTTTTTTSNPSEFSPASHTTEPSTLTDALRVFKEHLLTQKSNLATLEATLNTTFNEFKKLENKYVARRKRILELDDQEPMIEQRGGRGAYSQWSSKLARAEQNFRDVGYDLEAKTQEWQGFHQKKLRVASFITDTMKRRPQIIERIEELNGEGKGKDTEVVGVFQTVKEEKGTRKRKAVESEDESDLEIVSSTPAKKARRSDLARVRAMN